MRKIILVTGLLMVFSHFVHGQCPTPGFSLPDSVCAGSAFTLTNTSTVGQSYYWDMCPGDLNTVPVSSDIANAAMNLPQQLKMVTDNGNHYLFIANFLGNNLLRFDFGNSTDNTPVMYDYGSMGLINQPFGVDVIEEAGHWYALVASYGQNKIIRVDLGTDIGSNIASATDLGLFNLNFPFGIRIAKDGTDYYAFVSNSTGSDLTKVNFGNSITNTPSGFSATTDPLLSGSWGLDVVYDCSLNKWLVFVPNNSSGTLNIIDFGSSLSNTGTVLTPMPCVITPTNLTIVRDGKSWHILINSLGTELQNIKIDGNLLNAPTSIQNYVPGITSPRGITAYRDSVSYKVFIASGNDIKKLVFEHPCGATPPFSTDPLGVLVSSNISNAYHEITLEVTDANGATTVFSDSIFVQNTPIANFTHSPVCDGQFTTFTNLSDIDSTIVTSWVWDFGDSTPISNDSDPVHTFSGTGPYLVTLTATYPSGCTNSFSDSIFISPLPTADFSFNNNQCSNIEVHFNDLSVAFGGATLTAWTWDFGDLSAPDLTQNPVHNYDSAGVYTVILTTTASSGCTDTISQLITIVPSPESGFTVASTCVGEIAAFTNTTTISSGTGLTYNWDFGDTGSSIQTNPTHPYALSTGNYDVSLIATDVVNSCTDTTFLNIRIADKPVAQFSWSPLIVCVGNPVTFNNTSTGTGTDSISTYIWDFGDSTFSNDINPVYAYADTGTYDVTLTVISPTNCDSAITLQLTVITSPTASFTANNVCNGFTTTFNPLTTTPPGTTIDSIIWDFGDSNSFSGLTSPTHEYLNAGTYSVTMTVYNNLLCTDVFTDLVNVYPIPVAAFSTSVICSDSLTLYDGSISQVTGDTISSWLWDFDGLGTANGDSAYFNFALAGNYDVTLIVSTIHGCQDTVQNPITVIQSPEFDFIFNEPCFGLPSLFTYQPVIIPTPNSDLTWDFGDFTTSALLNPSHTYTTIDSFYVSLTVQHDSTGCIARESKWLVVKPYPVVGFTFNNSCEGTTVQFTDTSTISSGFIASWDWNFGVFGTSNSNNPMIAVTDSGTYPVSLTVTSGEGCAKVTSNTLTVYANPVASIAPNPLYGSPPLTVNFTNNTIGGFSYVWNFGDSTFGSGLSPDHIYQDTGQYEVTMVATSPQGCVDTTHTVVYVLIPYLDLAVNKIFISQTDNLIGLKAELLNFGNIPIYESQISGIIENGSVINEDWTGLLAPGATMTYEFTARYDINNKSAPGYYCVEVKFPNGDVDQNPDNDSKCAAISNSFEVYDPYPNPFHDQISVGFNLPEEDFYDIHIHDATGRLVYIANQNSGLKGFNNITIPAYTFAKGVYAFSLYYRDEVKVLKLMNY